MGSLSDLYNQDFEGAKTTNLAGVLVDPIGASLQAGVLTVGRNGEIFRAEL